MRNHIHLIAVPPDADSMAAASGRTHGDYARWLHIKRAETGRLWQNRYYSCPLDERHQWAALRYVELNPVRVGLTPAAEAWPWSSASAHTGGSDTANLLSDEIWRQQWTPAEWREALQDGVRDAAVLQRIRAATRTGRPAAGVAFIRDLENSERRTLTPMKRGRKPKPVQEKQLELAVT